MNKINELELRLLAKGSNESFARSTVAAFCVELNPTLEELSEVKTAVSEAVTNCIVHGYEQAPSKYIDIKITLFDNNIAEIVIADKGVGISNIEEALQPCYTTKPEQERSGMGFTLMETFMSEMRVESVKNVGTTVYMRKKFSCKED